MRHAVAPLLLASALSAHEKSVWRTTTDLGLVQQYRNCTFMMSRYMADGDNQCNDSRFYVWREPKPPRTARALKRSSARASSPHSDTSTGQRDTAVFSRFCSSSRIPELAQPVDRW